MTTKLPAVIVQRKKARAPLLICPVERMNTKLITMNFPLHLPKCERKCQTNEISLCTLIENWLKSRVNLGLTSQNVQKLLETKPTRFSTVNSANNFNSTCKNSNWWAGPDLNRRPLARKANVLTKLDDRPPELVYSFSLFFYFLFRYMATWSFSL